MPRYSIEARSLDIAGGIAGHDFWVLRDERGTAIAELHGLATDRTTGRPVPVGDDESRYSLRVWHYPHDPAYARSLGVPPNGATYIQDGQPARTVLTADSREVLARWNNAVRSMGELNALDLNYPNLLPNALGSPVNSNSTYRTLGEIMGVQVRDFPWRSEPGVDNRMVSPERIQQLRTHGFPVLDEPRIDTPRRRAGLSLQGEDQAFFDLLRERLPSRVGDDAVLDGVLRAREAGIPRENVREVALVGDRAFVIGQTPGFRAELDLVRPPLTGQTVARLDALREAAPDLEQASRQRSGPALA